jgi:hypothetical protein
MPPTLLDIDAFLSQNHDYVNDFPSDQTFSFDSTDNTGTNHLNFSYDQDNDELFRDLPPQSSG